MLIKSFKGLNSNMTCKGFKFIPGVDYSIDDEEINLCTKGFHSCIIPIQCFSYYKPLGSVFYEADIQGAMEISKSNSKLVSSKINLQEELSTREIVERTYDVLYMMVNNTDRYAGTIMEDLANEVKDSYEKGAIAFEDEYRTIAYSTVEDAVYNGAVIHTGERSIAASTSFHKDVATSGVNSIAASVGKNNTVCAAGRDSIATSIGDYNVVCADEEGCVAVSLGENCKVIAEKKGSMAVVSDGSIGKGALNSYLVFTGTVKSFDTGARSINKVVTIYIDGTKYKANTWYKLDNGVVKTV